MIWLRAFAIWCVIAVAETAHGILRRLFLEPVVGPLRAHQIGVLVGSLIIFGIAWASIKWINARSPMVPWGIGVLWCALMLSFEIGLGLALNVPLDRILADYEISRGGLMVFGFLIMLASPTLAAKVRGL